MIDSNVELHALPWLPLSQRCDFPCTPAVYFAIDGAGVVQYIGMSKNPRQRWNQHHRYLELKELSDVRVAFLPVEDALLLPQIEAALIARFKPLLNGQSGDGTGDRFYITRPGGSGMDALKVEAWLSGNTIAGEVRSLLSEALEQQKTNAIGLWLKRRGNGVFRLSKCGDQILCGTAEPMSPEQYAKLKKDEQNEQASDDQE